MRDAQCHLRVASRLSGMLVASLFALLTHGGDAQGPTGVITATATQTRNYGSQVTVSYMEPVNCTLDFSEEVLDFGINSFNISDTTLILNLTQVDETKYQFQLASTINANVSVYIPALTITGNTSEVQNAASTAFFSFEFYAYPPAATLRLDGFEAQSTDNRLNLAYLVFNSTTVYNNTAFVTESLVSVSPALTISRWEQESDLIYKFRFVVDYNETAAASAVDCVLPNATLDVHQTMFPCSRCQRIERCMSSSTYPPADVSFMEFAFEVLVQPIPELGMDATSLPFLYDTLWAEVALDAPSHAREPFWVTVSWTEDMLDAAAVQPTIVGPAIDQVMLQQNMTILSPSSYKLLIAPTETGIVEIQINGTVDSVDLASNANNYQVNTLARTGDYRTIVFSSGPPLRGTVAFGYTRAGYLYEYPAAVSSPLATPTLSVTWDGFTTAEQYDMWISWGHNMSTPVLTSLTTTSHTFDNFRAMLGVEYTVYVRAYNIYGQATTVSSVFLHPDITVTADGSYSVMELPTFMSQLQTNVSFHVLVAQQAFMSLNPAQAMRFRAVDRAGGDADPCLVNSALQRCTFVNFHIEVPDTQFIVFRKAIRLQFTFGEEGWEDAYFEPQLRYWEGYQEEWRVASQSCPPDQRIEDWNSDLRIYTVSVCHLSQFAVFEAFRAPDPTTTTPPPPRPMSYENPLFFVILAAIVGVFVMFCALCFWITRRAGVVGSRDGDGGLGALGIRPVSERIPRFRGGVVAPLSPKEKKARPEEDDARLLLALPAPGPDSYTSQRSSGSSLVPPRSGSSRAGTGTSRSGGNVRALTGGDDKHSRSAGSLREVPAPIGAEVAGRLRSAPPVGDEQSPASPGEEATLVPGSLQGLVPAG